MMAMNKFAVNRAYEAMGLNQARDVANSLDTIAHTAEVLNTFAKTARKDGLKVALEENEAPFHVAPRPFTVPGDQH